jgi:CMP-N,N'-diacetyllegionaminic acid synthase
MSSGLIAVVPARAGSKRLPGKNSIEVGGKSLIARAVFAALGSEEIDRVFVDTDSPGLRNIAQEAGAEVPYLRPAHLATDDTTTAATILHLLEYLRIRESYAPKAVVTLQPTSPLRSALDVKTVVARWKEIPQRPVASVCRPLQTPRDLLLRTQLGEWIRLVPNCDYTEIMFEDGSVYVTPVSYLREKCLIFRPEDGEVAEIPPLHGIDVDEPFQLEVARALAAWTTN